MSGERKENSRTQIENFKRKYCPGCYCNDYNNGLGGAKECWSLNTAQVGKFKLVHINDVPPWNHKPVTTLNCYHKQQFVKVNSNITK